MARWVDQNAPPTDVFQPSDTATPEADDQDVDISGTKLPRLPLL
jgi:hypothetical protein